MLLTLLGLEALGPILERRTLDKELGRLEFQLQQKMKRGVPLLQQTLNSSPIDAEHLITEANNEGIYLYLFHGQRPSLWSTNKVIPEAPDYDDDTLYREFGNGKFLQLQITGGQRVAVALIPLRFSYRNSQLNDRASELLPDARLEFKYSQNPPDQQLGGDWITAGSGRPLFYASIQQIDYNYNWLLAIYLISWLVIGVMLLYSLPPLYHSRGRQLVGLLLHVLYIFSVVYLWKMARMPQLLFQHPLFDATHYASSTFLASLGDLLILLLLVGWHMLLLLRLDWRIVLWPEPRYLSIAIGIIHIVSLIAFQELYYHLYLDGDITLNIAQPLSLSTYGWLSIIAFCTLLLLHLLLLLQWCSYLHNAARRWKWQYWLALLLPTIASAYLQPLWLIAAAYASLGTLIFLQLSKGKKPSVLVLLAAVGLASLFFTTINITFQTKNYQLQQEASAESLVNRQDVLAEYLFSSVQDNIASDPFLKSYFKNPSLSERLVQQRIQQLYLAGYFKKYNIEVKTFTTEGYPLSKNDLRPLQVFKDMIGGALQSGSSQSSLLLINEFNKLPYYISAIPISDESKEIGHVVISLQEKLYQQKVLYPELLLEQEASTPPLYEGWSYAIYQGGKLVNRRGLYPYKDAVTLQGLSAQRRFAHYTEGQYRHTLYQAGNDLQIIISRPAAGFFIYIATYSYYLFVMIIISLIAWLFVVLHSRYLRFNTRTLPLPLLPALRRYGFRWNILLSLLGTTSFAAVLIGAASVVYIATQYKENEENVLKVRSAQVASRLETRLSDRDARFGLTVDELEAYLRELADLYQLDITVFDQRGALMVTTQPAIYEQGLLAPIIAPLTYLRFIQERHTQLIAEENLGNLRYSSAYSTIRSSDGAVLGYVHLPNFYQQRNLRDQINNFLNTLINIYVFVLLVLLAFSTFISRQLTHPLNQIRNQLRKSANSSSNIRLHWDKDDEIGSLVNEYNEVLSMLETKAEQLAQAEREGAWQELAKQAAHEINNPLSPMKLQLQRLEMAWHQQREDLPRLFEITMRTVINQIDSLSKIASEFKDMARMPEGVPTDVEPDEILRELEVLHHPENNTYQLEISLNCEGARVKIDRTHLSRVLDNLIRNGIQALSEDRERKVLVQTSCTVEQVYIKVEDTGRGIPAEIQPNIFKPNFTTKSTGMGMGLAICSATIRKASGSLTFTTAPDEGTTFTLTLPRIQYQSDEPDKEIPE